MAALLSERHMRDPHTEWVPASHAYLVALRDAAMVQAPGVSPGVDRGARLDAEHARAAGHHAAGPHPTRIAATPLADLRPEPLGRVSERPAPSFSLSHDSDSTASRKGTQ